MGTLVSDDSFEPHAIAFSIPALLVSMAGGLITTRAASESHLGEEVAEQLLARPRPLAVAAGVLMLLALIPGLPKLAFRHRRRVLGGRVCGTQQARSGRGSPRPSRRRDRRRASRRSASIRSASRWATRSSARRRKTGRDAADACAHDPSSDRDRDRHRRFRRCESPTTCSSGRAATGSW